MVAHHNTVAPRDIILFIPFAASENNASLYSRALEWIQSYKDANKPEKVPTIVIYRLPKETDADYTHMQEPSRFPANMHKNTVVYVLADGMGDSHFTGNSVNPDNLHLISIGLIAHRAKQCGLTNINNIKLYICEMKDQNEQLAINFAKALGSRFINTKISYYTKMISVPDELDNEIHKLAVDKYYYVLGRAKDFKKTITVAKALLTPSAVYSRNKVEKYVQLYGLTNEVVIDDAYRKKSHVNTIAPIHATPPKISNTSFGFYTSLPENQPQKADVVVSRNHL